MPRLRRTRSRLRWYEKKQAARVEAALCAVVRAYGLEKVLADIDLAPCRITKQWIEDWWQQHQRKDEIQRRIRETRDTHVLYRMIEREEDIFATVLIMEDEVPPGCETFRPPRPTASDVLTSYQGNVRV
jgi:hypothetical protein